MNQPLSVSPIEETRAILKFRSSSRQSRPSRPLLLSLAHVSLTGPFFKLDHYPPVLSVAFNVRAVRRLKRFPLFLGELRVLRDLLATDAIPSTRSPGRQSKRSASRRASSSRRRASCRTGRTDLAISIISTVKRKSSEGR